MDRHELLKHITSFPIIADKLADELMAGDFQGVFKGQGIEFDEVRHYEMGDDVRAIDWNVSARFGTPYVKMFKEEREMNVFLLFDCSASMRTGGVFLSRFEQALLAGALTAFSGETAGQRVGALLFDVGISKIIPPRKGRSHVMSLVLDVLNSSVSTGGSALGPALTATGRLLKRRSMVVIISDFLCVDWEREFGALSRKHDLIALRIYDPMEFSMPKAGLVHIRDPETGVELHAPTGFRSFREAWNQWHRDRSEAWKAHCHRYGSAYMELSTAEDAVASLARLFGRRRRP